jgi:monofunctional biosynthetic peptidoglycan transglycosylase
LGKVIDEAAKAGEPDRGASTITQQLVKNLFLTTRGSYLRKVAEVPLALLAELILSKDRILELYLNVVEWGPGVFGAEAAARHHYHTSSAALSRDQAARLAACLPSPRRWRPQQMDRYSNIILQRMRRMGY